MRAVSLCYHDVIDNKAFDASGFPGASAASYKLDREQMQTHFDALSATAAQVVRADADIYGHGTCPLLLTFDDGGGSALQIADMLERHGWKGNFLVTAGRIGRRGFLTAAELLELHQRGHLIGSHSWSHPERITCCSDAELRDEWHRSVTHLSGLIGSPVTTASVPGGFYSRRVAAAAVREGVRVLFTSEPRKRIDRVAGCLVLGRYCVQRDTPLAAVTALASTKRSSPQQRQYLFWNLKKVLKLLGGSAWHAAREAWWRQKKFT